MAAQTLVALRADLGDVAEIMMAEAKIEMRRKLLEIGPLIEQEKQRKKEKGKQPVKPLGKE
jgi:hypothetical protein